ncbi:MAG: hypothetical protein AAF654_04475 [Myxococcota bacterium]
MRWTLLISLLLLASAQAVASTPEKALEQRARRLGELAPKDTTGEAAPHIEVMRTLIQRAQNLLAEDEEELANRVLSRVDRLEGLVVAIYDRVVRETEAIAIEQKAASAKAKADAAEAERDASKRRFEALEAKGL